jgi:hypothetical protein
MRCAAPPVSPARCAKRAYCDCSQNACWSTTRIASSWCSPGSLSRRNAVRRTGHASRRNASATRPRFAFLNSGQWLNLSQNVTLPLGRRFNLSQNVTQSCPNLSQNVTRPTSQRFKLSQNVTSVPVTVRWNPVSLRKMSRFVTRPPGLKMSLCTVLYKERERSARAHTRSRLHARTLIVMQSLLTRSRSRTTTRHPSSSRKHSPGA